MYFLSYSKIPIFHIKENFKEIVKTIQLYRCKTRWYLHAIIIIFKNSIKSIPCSSLSKESVCSAGDPGSIPGLGRSPGGRHGNPLQYSCLENLIGRGAWATVHGGHEESDTAAWLTLPLPLLLLPKAISTSRQLSFFFQWQLLLSLLLVFISSPYRVISPSSLESENWEAWGFT